MRQLFKTMWVKCVDFTSVWVKSRTSVDTDAELKSHFITFHQCFITGDLKEKKNLILFVLARRFLKTLDISANILLGNFIKTYD